MSSDVQVNKHETVLITNYVKNFFGDLEKTLTLAGHNIRLFGSTPEKIGKTLGNISRAELSYVLGSYVSWADAHGHIVVSGRKGILPKDEVKNISDRPCFKRSQEEGWLLRVSSATKNMFNSRVVLPTTMMICDEHKKTLGFMVLGLNLDNLINHLRVFLSEDDILQITFNRDGLRLIVTLLDYRIEHVHPDSDAFISVSHKKSDVSLWRSFLSDYFLYMLLLLCFLCFIYINNKRQCFRSCFFNSWSKRKT